MVARSPLSPLPSPPTRHLGPGPPRGGLGADVHTVRGKVSSLAGAAWEGVADKSDIFWRGTEGSEDPRGPGGEVPAHAPLLSAPLGSRRLEGISVEEAMVTRTQLLEEELRSLKEELALCQVSRTVAAGLSLHCGAGTGGRRALHPVSWASTLRGPRPAALPLAPAPSFSRRLGAQTLGSVLCAQRPSRVRLSTHQGWVCRWNAAWRCIHPAPSKPVEGVVFSGTCCPGVECSLGVEPEGVHTFGEVHPRSTLL